MSMPNAAPIRTVWIYVDAHKSAGDADHIKAFASRDAADEWFKGKRSGRRRPRVRGGRRMTDGDDDRRLPSGKWPIPARPPRRTDGVLLLFGEVGDRTWEQVPALGIIELEKPFIPDAWMVAARIVRAI
jgi:hypothetical protein